MPSLPTGIDRLPSGKYRIRVTVAGRRITRTTRTLSEARTLRNDLERTAPTASGTVDQLIEQWMIGKLSELGDNTALGYETVIRLHIHPHIGDRQYADITSSDIDQLYIDLLADGVSPNQISHAHVVLSQAFERAARWHAIPYSPAAAVKPPPKRTRDIDPPTAEQVGRLLEAAETIHKGFGAYCRLAAVAGARRGEMVALRGTDIDLDAGDVVISRAFTRAHSDPTRHRGAPVPGWPRLVEKKTKTGNIRRIAIDTTTVKILRAHRRMLAERAMSVGAGFDLATHWWFTDDPSAAIPWEPNQPTYWWQRTRNTLDLPGIRLHDLRHFAATQALAAGVDVRTVAGRLGHANASMTLDRYSHVIPAADRAAADILGDIVSG